MIDERVVNSEDYNALRDLNYCDNNMFLYLLRIIELLGTIEALKEVIESKDTIIKLQNEYIKNGGVDWNNWDW